MVDTIRIIDGDTANNVHIAALLSEPFNVKTTCNAIPTENRRSFILLSNVEYLLQLLLLWLRRAHVLELNTTGLISFLNEKSSKQTLDAAKNGAAVVYLCHICCSQRSLKSSFGQLRCVGREFTCFPYLMDLHAYLLLSHDAGGKCASLQFQ